MGHYSSSVIPSTVMRQKGNGSITKLMRAFIYEQVMLKDVIEAYIGPNQMGTVAKRKSLYLL